MTPNEFVAARLLAVQCENMHLFPLQVGAALAVVFGKNTRRILQRSGWGPTDASTVSPHSPVKLGVWAVGRSWPRESKSLQNWSFIPNWAPCQWPPSLCGGGGHCSLSVVWHRVTSSGLENHTDLALNPGSATSLLDTFGLVTSPL